MTSLLLLLTLPQTAWAQDAEPTAPTWDDVAKDAAEDATETPSDAAPEGAEPATEARLAAPAEPPEAVQPAVEAAPEPAPTATPEAVAMTAPEAPPEPLYERPEPRIAVDYRTGYVNNDYGALYNLVDGNNRLNGKGVRVGVRPLKRLQLQGSWHHARSGRWVQVEGANDDFVAAFFGNTFALGARVDANLANFIFPYAQVDGSLLWGQTRFDNDPDRINPEGQLSWSATAIGFSPSAGVEVRVPQGNLPGTVAVFLEMGHTFRPELAFEDLGAMDTSGFSLHGGFGLRF